MKKLTIIITAGALVAAGCGGDDDSSGEQTSAAASSPQTCIDSWNVESNQGYQTALAGAISASGADPEAIQVGTWPKSERTVQYRSAKDAFSDTATGKATVPSGACLIVFPPSQAGELTFFEDQGKWYLVIAPIDESNGEPSRYCSHNTHTGQSAYCRSGEKFPVAAKRSIADAETATADALGKLTLR